MKILPVGAQLFHADRQTDRQTDRHNAANSCYSQFCKCVCTVKQQQVCHALYCQRCEFSNHLECGFV